MSATNYELVQFAALKINLIDENSSPSAEQGVTALNVLNDMMANIAADGVHIGWYPQTNAADTSPLQNEDVGPVKYLLCAALASHYGIVLAPLLIAEIESAWTRLVKRAMKEGEADLSELPRAQGPRWMSGGGFAI